MFSVVIPLYNKANFVYKCLESVLNQTFNEFEVIVIDDGSTDDSLSIASSLDDTRIKIISQPNSGVSTARNIGVSHAQYDYIAFLDGDDWWSSDFLSEIKTLIKLCPEAKLFATNYYQVKRGSKIKANIGIPVNFQKGYINYFQTYANTFCMPITSSSVTVSKDAFNKSGGFSPFLKFSEDLDLWIRLALKYKVAFSNTPLAYYNQDVDQSNRALSRHKIWKKHEHAIFNFKYLSEDERKNSQLKKLLDGLRVRSLLYYYLKKIEPKEVDIILREVRFSEQPLKYRFIYNAPRFMVLSYIMGKTVGSQIKASYLNRVKN